MNPCPCHEPFSKNRPAAPCALDIQRYSMGMTMFDINDLLMQINALRDNAAYWTSADVETCASTLQRMAANLPGLVAERDRALAAIREHGKRHCGRQDGEPTCETCCAMFEDVGLTLTNEAG